MRIQCKLNRAVLQLVRGGDEGEEMCEEELVDYDEDPAVAEKIEMAELEKKIESRAQTLIEKAAINIPVEIQ
jgi:hypothetical protein